MLILRRINGETIKIGDDITITVLSHNKGVTEIGIEAPSDQTILRGELYREAKSINLQRRKIIRRRQRLCPVCGGNYSDFSQRERRDCCKAAYLSERADYQSREES